MWAVLDTASRISGMQLPVAAGYSSDSLNGRVRVFVNGGQEAPEQSAIAGMVTVHVNGTNP